MGIGKSFLGSIETSSNEIEEVSAASTDIVERPNIRMVQNVLLIWLDNNIDENNPDCKNTMSQLRRFVNNIHTFTDSDKCIEFIKTLLNEKICMIISGALGERIIPTIHNMSQMDSIFIFCCDQQRHKQWTEKWSKIKGIYTDISAIYTVLKETAQQCERNTMTMSFMATDNVINNKNSNKLDCSFMYTQILKEILLTITFEQEHFEQFIVYCKELFVENGYELDNVEKLKREYHQQTPIWWYTYESYLYSMLNRALRTMDATIIISMGFYVGDLHRQIEQLHSKQFNRQHCTEMFTLYRGQGLSKTDFIQLQYARGGLMAFNNFLSTSRNRNVSLNFARKSCSNPDIVGILFLMSIDPTQSTTPFASITEVGCFADLEDEVLFSMHTIFRIENIQQIDEEQRLFQVNLRLTNENDRDLHVLTDRIREDIEGSTGWYAIGEILCKMGQFDKVKEVYQVLLNRTNDENEKACIYDRLATAKSDQGEYLKAIELYKKALKIKQTTLFPNHPYLAASYNNIGSAYLKIGQYFKSLPYYEKALEIQQQSLPTDHLDLSMSFNNLGVLCDHIGDYSKAFSYYNKCLAIRRQSLPSNHPSLGDCYNNLGIIYRNMKKNSEALSYYEKSLRIRRQSLPLNHPDLSVSYNNIGEVYCNMNNPTKALQCYQKAMEIQQQSLPSNHPYLGVFSNNIGLSYEKLGDYTNARLHYKRAVDIARYSLFSNHPDRQQWEKNLQNIEKKL